MHCSSKSSGEKSLRSRRLLVRECPGVETGLPSHETDGVRNGDRAGLENFREKFISEARHFKTNSRRSLLTSYLLVQSTVFNCSANTIKCAISCINLRAGSYSNPLNDGFFHNCYNRTNAVRKMSSEL